MTTEQQRGTTVIVFGAVFFLKSSAGETTYCALLGRGWGVGLKVAMKVLNRVFLWKDRERGCVFLLCRSPK